MGTLRKRSYGIEKGPDRWQVSVALLRGFYEGTKPIRQSVTVMLTPGKTTQELKDEQLLEEFDRAPKQQADPGQSPGYYQVELYITGVALEAENNCDRIRFAGRCGDNDFPSSFKGVYDFSTQSGRLEFVDG